MACQNKQMVHKTSLGHNELNGITNQMIHKISLDHNELNGMTI